MSRTWATYIVSGAGKSQVNGTYIETEKDVYTYGVYWITKNAQFGFWKIVDARYENNVIYQSTDATETPDLATWSVGSHGTEPPPTVVAGTPIQGNPDILVSGAGSDLVNGTYEHTDFEDGKPLYTKGSERYKVVNYGSWLIFAPYTDPDIGIIDYPYYQEKPSESGSPATPDLVAEWEIYTNEGEPTAGVNPPPNVTEVPIIETHIIEISNLSAKATLTPIVIRRFKMGTYAYSGNQNKQRKNHADEYLPDLLNDIQNEIEIVEQVLSRGEEGQVLTADSAGKAKWSAPVGGSGGGSGGVIYDGIEETHEYDSEKGAYKINLTLTLNGESINEDSFVMYKTSNTHLDFSSSDIYMMDYTETSKFVYAAISDVTEDLYVKFYLPSGVTMVFLIHEAVEQSYQ